MTQSLAEKARANRRAALASLNARIARSENVISIFDRVIRRRQTVPQFHTTRSHVALANLVEPMAAATDPRVA